VFWGLGAVAVGLSAVVSLLAPWLVPLVLGARYEEAARIFGVHVWALPGVCLVSLRSRFLVIEAGTRWIFSISLLTALFNFSANLILIPRHGGLGAAWATVGAWFFSAAVAPWFFPATRTLTLDLIRSLARS
jgi:O-antigen/teichoic acid export membrane protein